MQLKLKDVSGFQVTKQSQKTVLDNTIVPNIFMDLSKKEPMQTPCFFWTLPFEKITTLKIISIAASRYSRPLPTIAYKSADTLKRFINNTEQSYQAVIENALSEKNSI